MGQSCEIPDGERQFILDKVKTKITEALGPPPIAASTPEPPQRSEIPAVIEKRILRKRHSQKSLPGEDTSQVLLFPSSDILCETNLEVEENYNYVFRPSSHILSRRVSSVQFWFFTGKSMMASSTNADNSELKPIVPSPTPCLGHNPQLNESSNSEESMADNPIKMVSKEETRQSQVDIQVLSEDEPVTVATTKIQKMDDWTMFELAPAFFSYLTRSIFVLLVHCPDCPCSEEPENTPFLMFHTRPVQRGRRSGVPWSPSVLELLQRPPALGADSAQCHRGSINISFEELGWNQWIVHPGSFQFHYCHGTCSPNHGFTPALHWGNCCAALPSTMKPLRVTTTTDGGFSFRYETVPNLLTQDCACS
ncbi:inhibin alpha chain [Gastrophryne carolinensis]